MQMQSSRPISTFTMRFEHAPYDESPVARAVAQHLGTDHHEAVIANGCFSCDDLWRIVRHVGQPFADSSAIPMYQISRHISAQVKVCLSGDGGDEMFAGYDYFRWLLKTDLASRLLPARMLRIVGSSIRAARHLLKSHPDGILRMIQRGFEVASVRLPRRMWVAGELFTPTETASLLNGANLSESVPAIADGQMRGEGENTHLRALMFHRLRYSLPEDMLVKVDRMSMANGLEVRSPLLDADLAQFAMNLDDDLLIRGGIGKRVLRETVRPWLPNEVFTHPKRGFSIPLHKYQNDTYQRLCRELLQEETSTSFSAIFSADAVGRCVTQGLKHDPVLSRDVSVYRASHQLWALLQVGAWMHQFEVTV